VLLSQTSVTITEDPSMTREPGFNEAPPDDGQGMTPEQGEAMRIMANHLHRLNQAVVRCVDSGLTVELVRAARYHDEAGNWGDQLLPIVRTR
jgi:hypothetical protein